MLPWWDVRSAALIPACPDASQPPSLMQQCCWDSLRPNDTFWSVSHVYFIHEVKSGCCSQVLLLLNQSLNFFLQSQSYFFSFLLCIFLANPVVHHHLHCCCHQEQGLTDTCADWGMKWPVVRNLPRHTSFLCPAPLRSFIWKKEHFHLCFDPGEFPLLKNYELTLSDWHTREHKQTNKGSLLKTAWLDKNTCCTI